MSRKIAEPGKYTTIEEVIDEVKKLILLKDPGVIKAIIATIVASRLPIPMIWLLVVGPSSSGKTVTLNPLLGLNDYAPKRVVFPISDMTSNTLASGMRSGDFEEDSSLLEQARGGVLLFKDLTTLLSKNDTVKQELFSQLREVYDGGFVKRTGNKKNIEFKGKICVIGGVTQAIYEYEADMAVMGQRFVYYAMEQPDELEATRRSIDVHFDKEFLEEHLADVYGTYLSRVFENLDFTPVQPPPDVKEDIVQLSAFCAAARAGVIRDRMGRLSYAPTRELPTRIAGELTTLYAGLVAMRRAETDGQNEDYQQGLLSDADYAVVYKVAFDTIPIKRITILRALATYTNGATVAGLAQTLRYPYQAVTPVLEELHAHDIVFEETGTGGRKRWKIQPQYLRVLQNYENIKQVEGELITDDEELVGEAIDSLSMTL